MFLNKQKIYSSHKRTRWSKISNINKFQFYLLNFFFLDISWSFWPSWSLTKLLNLKNEFQQKSESQKRNLKNDSQIFKDKSHKRIFGSKFRFLSKSSIFVQNFDSCTKFQFLYKISIFVQNFNFCPKFQFLSKISIFFSNNFKKWISKISTKK
mgnify:CR=1 FL=1